MTFRRWLAETANVLLIVALFIPSYPFVVLLDLDGWQAAHRKVRGWTRRRKREDPCTR